MSNIAFDRDLCAAPQPCREFIDQYTNEAMRTVNSMIAQQPPLSAGWTWDVDAAMTLNAAADRYGISFTLRPKRMVSCAED